jgi:hypothetical protein
VEQRPDATVEGVADHVGPPERSFRAVHSWHGADELQRNKMAAASPCFAVASPSTANEARVVDRAVAAALSEDAAALDEQHA